MNIIINWIFFTSEYNITFALNKPIIEVCCILLLFYDYCFEANKSILKLNFYKIFNQIKSFNYFALKCEYFIFFQVCYKTVWLCHIQFLFIFQTYFFKFIQANHICYSSYFIVQLRF